MRRRLLTLMLALTVTLLVSLLFALPASAASTISVPDDYSEIQSAIDAASPGDTILVSLGTYDEQLLITIDDLAIVAADPDNKPVIAPSTLVGDKAIVKIDGATGVVIDGFGIKGPVQGINYGVMVVGSGAATIKNCVIEAIRDPVFSGRQSGIAILVGRGSIGQTGSATIINNVITDFQKGGIVVDNDGSYGEILDNVVVGHGKTSITAQNGIQISRGAAALIRGNSISDVWYDTGVPGQGQERWWSAGLLLYLVNPTDLEISKNHFRGCHVNRLLVVQK